ncbi:membrane dipeptidase [Paracoccus sp. S1E-3]|uniref:dipeptidase n=1 Tax=Paracoccus sp. S1E-3 TaxID=2756130 RepID=UPI0015EF582A|nr:membrane dipeptidase [Paracoccus sp. S1E-3]MBA4490148.1 membrane dipeptidase [Paracoccus sp. S1E-3]
MLRKILLAVLGLIVIAAVAFFTFAPGYVERGLNPVTTPKGGWPVSAEAQALHDRLTIGDWHSDALLWDRDLLKRVDRGHTDIPRLQQGNVAVQVFTTVTKSPSGLNYGQNSADAPDNITKLVMGQLRPIRTWSSLKERALDQAARLRAMAERDPENLKLILTRDDLAALLAARAGGANTVGAILGTEGGHPLEGDIANLQTLYDAGFRLMGLTHFFDNELGGSLHGESGAGLTDFGRQVVDGLMERGMVIDLAHTSPQMVRDVLAIEGTRPIISHTGIRGNCATQRNLPDDLVQAVAAKGGVIGIGYWRDVNCGATPADIAKSIAAAIALVGEDQVSLGSDYDGSVDAPFDTAGLPALTQALMDQGLTEAQIAKVMGGNMMRYLAETLPGN